MARIVSANDWACKHAGHWCIRWVHLFMSCSLSVSYSIDTVCVSCEYITLHSTVLDYVRPGQYIKLIPLICFFVFCKNQNIKISAFSAVTQTPAAAVLWRYNNNGVFLETPAPVSFASQQAWLILCTAPENNKIIPKKDILRCRYPHKWTYNLPLYMGFSIKSNI